MIKDSCFYVYLPARIQIQEPYLSFRPKADGQGKLRNWDGTCTLLASFACLNLSMLCSVMKWLGSLVYTPWQSNQKHNNAGALETYLMVLSQVKLLLVVSFEMEVLEEGPTRWRARTWSLAKASAPSVVSSPRRGRIIAVRVSIAAGLSQGNTDRERILVLTDET